MHSRGSGQPRLHTALAVVCLLTLLTLVAARADAALFRRSVYAPGQQVRVQGVVTDGKGRPLPDLRVTL